MSENFDSIMSRLPEDKRKHLHFILKLLGFQADEFKSNFIEALYNNFNSTEAVYVTVRNELLFKKSYTDYDKNGIPTLYDAKILSYIKDNKNIGSDYITATDISSFVYCPASYCIKKTFNELAKLEKETVIGSRMHEQNRLAIYIPEERKKYKFNQGIYEPKFYTTHNRAFFDDIRSSSIYYVGHSENPIRYFMSSKGRFAGQPDYIFTNKNGDNFIVEEKFKYYKNKSNILYLNHQAQTISYLLGLDTINAKYAYLVHWYYDYEEKRRIIEECIIHKFERNLIEQNNIRNIYQKILLLNQGTTLSFDTKDLDANKCAKCMVKIFCGHKTGRFTEVSVPYSKNYYTNIKS